MTLRCAILDDYQNVALTLADWTPLRGKVDITVFNDHLGAPDNVIKALADFDIICAMRERTPFRREIVEALPKLKLLLTSGARNASFDMEALKEKGIVVCGTGSFGNPTAGIAIGLMLELTRRIGFENARMKAGEKWQITLGQDVEGKTMGIIGLGKLGTRVAGIAKALGMTVNAWSQNLTKERCAEAGVGYLPKEELMATSDVISIHVILSARSRGLVSREDLARMKPSSYLINTARGPIVDEDALLDALRAKRIAGAGLDTYSIEPLPVDHPFRKLDNVVLTPHLGYATEQGYRRYYSDMVEDILGWLDGKPVRQIG
ncbi:2-hydroxyacid dehydrogenase [Afipia sp. P52-10]|uniref:D-2-hydroxyacid dehydrogenase family protein n=1 Tax=Afipia sp. P52-10 TaxID=1429916 RepID=UPI0003DEFB71|nr:D-2-hydroxyacid dehydrogenase family protein [Afipia sp. P52-10]ETR78810.1 2-hydroxyacid dehydrogenase [Afipia sp. P52-10]